MLGWLLNLALGGSESVALPSVPIGTRFNIDFFTNDRNIAFDTDERNINFNAEDREILL